MKTWRFSPILALVIVIIGFTAYFYAQKSEEISASPSLTLPVKKINKILTRQEEIAQALSSPENAVTRERIYTEEEINRMTRDDFITLLSDTQKKLPLTSEIKKLPEEALHHIPTPVLQAGRDLGLIREVVRIHPDYTELSLAFFDQCAKNINSPVPVQALCLTNLIELTNNIGGKLNLKSFPKEIVELTKIVTE